MKMRVSEKGPGEDGSLANTTTPRLFDRAMVSRCQPSAPTSRASQSLGSESSVYFSASCQFLSRAASAISRAAFVEACSRQFVEMFSGLIHDKDNQRTRWQNTEHMAQHTSCKVYTQDFRDGVLIHCVHAPRGRYCCLHPPTACHARTYKHTGRETSTWLWLYLSR